MEQAGALLGSALLRNGFWRGYVNVKTGISPPTKRRYFLVNFPLVPVLIEADIRSCCEDGAGQIQHRVAMNLKPDQCAKL